MPTKEIEFPIVVTEEDKRFNVTVLSKEEAEKLFERPNGLESIIQSIESIARGLVVAGGTSSKEGISQIKAMVTKVAGVKLSLDNIGKEIVAEMKERPKKIDANRKSMRDRLEALQEEIRRPVTEIEERGKLILNISARPMNVVNENSDAIRKAIAVLDREDLSEDRWKESHTAALTAVANAMKSLQGMLATAEKREADAAEFERMKAENARLQREKDNERIRQEATAKAKKDADDKAALQLEASRLREEKAQKEADDAKKQLSDLKVEKEPRAIEPQATPTAVPVADIAVVAGQLEPAMQRAVPNPIPSPSQGSKWAPSEVEKREEERQYRKVCNREAAEDIASTILAAGEYDIAKAIIAAIIKGEIRHTKMEYWEGNNAKA